MTPARLLRDLIALPSVNPAFAGGPGPHTGEHDVAEFLAGLARRLGFAVEFQPVLPERANLLARLVPPEKPRLRILLAPHLDTVDGAPGQFMPRLAAGRLHGRGACDTKGSVAAMFSALAGLADSRRRPRQTEILFAGLVDEEHGQTGSRRLAASGLRADLAIVGEPTRLQVVTAHKGDVWLRLQTHGKAAHGSCPERGRNAVALMARVVQVLETEYARFLRARRHPLLGRPTVNVGAISGGRQPNIVPASCEISVDRRTVPGETEASVRAEVRACLRRRGLRATFAGLKTAPCLPLDTDARRPLVRQFLACAGQARPAGASFFCDASVLSHGGLPSVVFGPGDIAQAHTADEWVSLRAVDAATATLSRFLQGLP